MRRLFFMLSFMAAASATAQAADFPIKAYPAVAPITVYNWQGAYAGLNAGYGWGNVKSTGQSLTTDGRALGLPAGTFSPAATFAGADGSGELKGATVGGFAGYNWQIGKVVIGPETEFYWSDFKSGNAFSGSAMGPQYATAIKGDFGGSTVARIGYDLGNYLPYVKAGVGYQHFDTGLTVTPGPAGHPTGPALAAGADKWQFGWVAGLGVDVKVAGNWLLGVDYTHADYGKSNYSYALAVNNIARATGHPTNDTVKVRIGYAFNGL
jgi:outer membrane immunogenic protein